MGLGEGVAPSGATDMVARCIAKEERSRAISFIFSGAAPLARLLPSRPNPSETALYVLYVMSERLCSGSRLGGRTVLGVGEAICASQDS